MEITIRIRIRIKIGIASKSKSATTGRKAWALPLTPRGQFAIEPRRGAKGAPLIAPVGSMRVAGSRHPHAGRSAHSAGNGRMH
jgi:hypothetical protein